jgi:hypothetical protein
VRGTQESEVRSPVTERGHLIPVGQTEGPIIATEPSGRVSPLATVLGAAVHTRDAEALQEAILTPLFDHYAAEHGIKAEPAEIDAFVAYLRQGLAAEGLTAEEALTPEETAEIDSMRHDMARAIVRQWKINKALYAQYGGRIIYQQLGPEPLDAYREFLEQRQADGAFRIDDPALAQGSWRYFTDESIHDFMEPVTRQTPAGYRHGRRVTGMPLSPLLPPPSRTNRPLPNRPATPGDLSRTRR